MTMSIAVGLIDKKNIPFNTLSLCHMSGNARGKTATNQPARGGRVHPGAGLRQITLPQAVPTPYKGWPLYFPEQGGPPNAAI